MKAKQIALILIPLNIILAYFAYNSINSEVEFQKVAELRIDENIQKLKDLRQIQIAYKKANNTYSNNFKSLIDFLENDSIAIVKAIGETPDTLTDAQALESGEITYDTAYVWAKETVFDEAYLNSRDEKFPLDMEDFSILTTVPHSGKNYSIEAGEIESSQSGPVKVFEISTTYGTIFTGLDAENKSFELDEILKIGSMDKVSIYGNWGE